MGVQEEPDREKGKQRASGNNPATKCVNTWTLEVNSRKDKQVTVQLQSCEGYEVEIM